MKAEAEKTLADAQESARQKAEAAQKNYDELKKKGEDESAALMARTQADAEALTAATQANADEMIKNARRSVDYIVSSAEKQADKAMAQVAEWSKIAREDAAKYFDGIMAKSDELLSGHVEEFRKMRDEVRKNATGKTE